MPYSRLSALCLLALATMQCNAFDVVAVIRAPVASDLSVFDAENLYEQPFVNISPFVLENFCDSSSVSGHYYRWARSDQVPGGIQAVQELVSKLRSGVALNGYLHVESENSTPIERRFALCRVRSIHGQNGPPIDCATVAIFSTHGTWIRTKVDSLEICLASSNYRPSGAIQIEFAVDTEASPSQIAASIAHVLQDEFKLAVEASDVSSNEKTDYAYLRSTAGLRDSRILSSGWREALDVDVTIWRRGKTLEVKGVVHALVSRQAVGTLIHYTGLDDSQRAKYSSTIEASIESGIRLACNEFTRLDAKRLRCK